jgi:Tfp pilus assembly protein PilN
MAAAPNELSFLPDDYLERKARRRTNAICAVLFCIVISAIGGAFTVTERSMREINKQYDDIQSQYTDAAKRIEQVQQMQDKQRTMAHQAELTAGLLEKVPRSKVLAEITNGIPTGVSLMGFTMQSQVMTNVPSAQPKTAFELRQAEINGGNNTIAGIPVAQARVYDVKMELTGVAPTDVQVAAFIAKLNGSSMFREVNLIVTEEWKDITGSTTSDKGSKMRRFIIEMKLNPNFTAESSNVAASSTAKDAKVKTAALDTK